MPSVGQLSSNILKHLEFSSWSRRYWDFFLKGFRNSQHFCLAFQYPPVKDSLWDPLPKNCSICWKLSVYGQCRQHLIDFLLWAVNVQLKKAAEKNWLCCHKSAIWKSPQNKRISAWPNLILFSIQVQPYS